MTGTRTFDELLADLRVARGFDPVEVLASKVGRITRWCRAEVIDAVVVGLSGGVDSAVVLGLLMRALEAEDSPLRRVVAVSIPIDGQGATGQDVAVDRARSVAAALGAELWICPLGDAHVSLTGVLADAAGRRVDDWAAGQMLSVERTPVLYGAAALLQTEGLRSVVCGTTNRDEGAYLGFFGKASDAMVDLQPISDLHKSEVVALGRALGIPVEVLDAAPRGDVWDGRTDVEMIGVGYDDVEMVLRLREVGRDPAMVAATLGDADRLRRADEAVEELHAVNAHKYRVGNPSIHLDVLPRHVPGGWTDATAVRRAESPPVGLPGAWTPPPIRLGRPGLPSAVRWAEVIEAEGVLTESDCAQLVAAVLGAPGEPVDVSGVIGGLGQGSTRATAFCESLSNQLWERVQPVVPSIRVLGPLDPSEGHATATRPGHRVWRVVGMSPLLRFMRYRPGGRHLCHYDAAYEYPDGRRTLMSVVFFLTGSGSPELGGALRFVGDGQAAVPIWERNHADWARDTLDHEVLRSVAPRVGAVALFDHRRCHDVQRWLGDDDRVVIRGDIVFEPVLDGQGLG